MNEQNEFIKNYLHTEYVGCLKTDHEKCIDLQYEEIGNFVPVSYTHLDVYKRQI